MFYDFFVTKYSSTIIYVLFTNMKSNMKIKYQLLI